MKEWVKLTVAAALIAFTLIVVAAARAAPMRVGITDPNAIPSADAVALGVTWNRETLFWHGEDAYAGTLSFTPGVRTTVLVMGTAPTTQALLMSYCSFLGSLLQRYPQVEAVNVGGEPLNWSDYRAWVSALRTCGPVVHEHGALIGGVAFHPYQVQTSTEWLPTIAALGRAIDFVSIDPYWAYTLDATFVRNARAAFGWRIPVWIVEDGIDTVPDPAYAHLYVGQTPPRWTYWVGESSQPAYLVQHMLTAYCAGISRWANFERIDEAALVHWQSGLRRPDGSRKLAYDAFAAASALIGQSKIECAAPTPIGPPSRHWDGPRCALASKYCPWERKL